MPRYRGLTPGIDIRRIVLPGPVRIVQVRLDLTKVRLESVTATQDVRGYGTLRQVADREHALLAVNGDLAASGAPAHLLLHDGVLVTTGSAAGASLVFDETGARASLGGRPIVIAERTDTDERLRIARWNAGIAPGQMLSAFTEGVPPFALGSDTCWAWLHGTRSGAAITRYQVDSAGCGSSRDAGPGVLLVAPRAGPSGRWVAQLSAGAPIAVGLRAGFGPAFSGFGGVPALVQDGEIVRSRCGPLTCALHPRTAAGITPGCTDDLTATPCRLLIMVVDGRRPGWSIGVTTDRLARLVRRLGAYEAINLDGGASTQVLYGDRSLNRVAPGARRAVVSALIVHRRARDRVVFPLRLARW
jgi:hypothetical protein